jgi:hypothetical protein
VVDKQTVMYQTFDDFFWDVPKLDLFNKDAIDNKWFFINDDEKAKNFEKNEKFEKILKNQFDNLEKIEQKEIEKKNKK